MNVLLINAGSSSLKVSLRALESAEQVASSAVDWAGAEVSFRLQCGEEKRSHTVDCRDPATALTRVLKELAERFPDGLNAAAVGHRVVHGGDLTASAPITDELMATLTEISELAPLHNPPSLAAIAAARVALPAARHIAIFDTAFHRTMLAQAGHYAVPQEWTEKWRIKRYGFHGLSHAYCAKRAAELFGQPIERVRIIVCHLGHGCSASAVSQGKCLDTTMGFTPLDGLMMATRCGAIDPGAVLHVQQRYGLSPEQVLTVLNQRSGLLGVSGMSADMRKVIGAADEGHVASQRALEMFCYRVAQAVAALSVPLGGADAVVFTGGIGENSPRVREKVCERLKFLGCIMSPEANNAAGSDRDIATSQSRGRLFVIATQEDISMLGEVRKVLASGR